MSDESLSDEEEDEQIIDKKSHLTFSFPSLKRISHYNRNNPRILKNHQDRIFKNQKDLSENPRDK